MKYSFIENHSVEPEIVTISYVLTKSITFLVLFNKSFPVVERGSIGIIDLFCRSRSWFVNKSIKKFIFKIIAFALV